MATAKSRAERIRESVSSFRRKDEPSGPRVEKWQKEFEEKMRALRKFKPGSDDFNETVRRLYDLRGCLRQRINREALTNTLVDILNPGLRRKAIEVEQLTDSEERYISIRLDSWPERVNDMVEWDVSCYLSTTTHSAICRKATPTTLPTQVADFLRQEAKALNDMAAKIEKKYRTAGKSKKAAA